MKTTIVEDRVDSIRELLSSLEPDPDKSLALYEFLSTEDVWDSLSKLVDEWLYQDYHDGIEDGKRAERGF